MGEPGRRGRAGDGPAAALVALTVLLAALTPAAAGGNDPAGRLDDLHDDWHRYIGEIREVSAGRAAVSPTGIYSGLVRKGGRDPRIGEDAPVSGRGARNDMILYPSATDPLRSPGWLALILDHEYFHARHLARSGPAPLVDFEDDAANTAYYEATAWSFVYEKARRGVYGPLAPAEMKEVLATYRRHLKAFKTFVLHRQPAAWRHYGRFVVEPD